MPGTLREHAEHPREHGGEHLLPLLLLLLLLCFAGPVEAGIADERPCPASDARGAASRGALLAGAGCGRRDGVWHGGYNFAVLGTRRAMPRLASRSLHLPATGLYLRRRSVLPDSLGQHSTGSSSISSSSGTDARLLPTAHVVQRGDSLDEAR